MTVLWRLIFALIVSCSSVNDQQTLGEAILSKVSHDIDSEYRYYDTERSIAVVQSSQALLAGLHAVGGFTFGGRLSIGAGMGVERYSNPSIVTAPMYINMRMHLIVLLVQV